MATNARFLVYWNDGWVKLTLKPGMRLAVGHRNRTDEGWNSYGCEWRLSDSGEYVLWESWSDGVDCDGRFSSQTTVCCPLGKLSAHPGHDGTMVPLWGEIQSEQRDYSAEQAGY